MALSYSVVHSATTALSHFLVHSHIMVLSDTLVHSTVLVLSTMVVHSLLVVLSRTLVHSFPLVLSRYMVHFRLCVPVRRCYVVGVAFLCKYVWFRWWCAVLYVIGYVMPVGKEEFDSPSLGS